jgi:hypothetical protein
MALAVNAMIVVCRPIEFSLPLGAKALLRLHFFKLV